MTEKLEKIARIIELSNMRHGVDELDLEGTLTDAEDIMALFTPDPAVNVGAVVKALADLAGQAESIGQHLVYNAPTMDFAAAIKAARAALTQSEPQAAGEMVAGKPAQLTDPVGVVADMLIGQLDQLQKNEIRGGGLAWHKESPIARTIEKLRFALSTPPHEAGSPAPSPDVRVYPQDLTDDLRFILSMMMWTSGPMAHALRDGGQDIKRKAEEEQAEVMHWLIGLALEHGPAWREKASDRIREIQETLAATEVQP